MTKPVGKNRRFAQQTSGSCGNQCGRKTGYKTLAAGALPQEKNPASGGGAPIVDYGGKLWRLAAQPRARGKMLRPACRGCGWGVITKIFFPRRRTGVARARKPRTGKVGSSRGIIPGSSGRCARRFWKHFLGIYHSHRLLGKKKKKKTLSVDRGY